LTVAQAPTFLESVLIAAEPCGWTLLRCLPVVVLTLLLASPISATLRAMSKGRAHHLAWCLLLVPLLTPAILVGYAYADFALTLVHHPFWNTVWYLCLMTMRLTPLAVLVLLYAPPVPLGDKAKHLAVITRRLSGSTVGINRWTSRIRLWWQGPTRNRVVAGTHVFLLAFQEFEISSLMGIQPASWAEWLFDKQAVKPPLSESLIWSLPPLVIQLIVLAPLLWMVLSGRPARTQHMPKVAKVSMRSANGSWIYLLIAAAAGSFAPLVIVGLQSVGGFSSASSLRVALDSVLATTVFAAASAVLVFFVCAALVHAPGPMGPIKRAVTLGFCMPGLLGSLIVGLVILALFQNIPGPGYDTPLPLLTGLAVWLAPIAMLLTALAARQRAPKAIHAASKLAGAPAPEVRQTGRMIRWQLRGKRHMWVVLILFLLAFFDLGAAALLSPVGMTPASPVLYNLMHYGQNSVMSASVLLVVAAPAAILAAAQSGGWLVERLWSPHG